MSSPSGDDALGSDATARPPGEVRKLLSDLRPKRARRSTADYDQNYNYYAKYSTNYRRSRRMPSAAPKRSRSRSRSRSRTFKSPSLNTTHAAPKSSSRSRGRGAPSPPDRLGTNRVSTLPASSQRDPQLPAEVSPSSVGTVPTKTSQLENSRQSLVEFASNPRCCPERIGTQLNSLDSCLHTTHFELNTQSQSHRPASERRGHPLYLNSENDIKSDEKVHTQDKSARTLTQHEGRNRHNAARRKPTVTSRSILSSAINIISQPNSTSRHIENNIQPTNSANTHHSTTHRLVTHNVQLPNNSTVSIPIPTTSNQKLTNLTSANIVQPVSKSPRCQVRNQAKFASATEKGAMPTEPAGRSRRPRPPAVASREGLEAQPMERTHPVTLNTLYAQEIARKDVSEPSSMPCAGCMETFDSPLAAQEHACPAKLAQRTVCGQWGGVKVGERYGVPCNRRSDKNFSKRRGRCFHHAPT